MPNRIIRTLLGILVVLCLSISLAQAQSTALWLVTDNADHTELAIHPIDAISLQDIPDHPPISMGHHYISALSPDRQTLVAIIWPTQYSGGGVLHLIDLTTWEDHQTDATFDEYVNTLNFTPDGSTLYWIAPAKAAKTQPMQAGSGLFACDIANCDSTNLITPLGDDFSPEQAMLMQSGTQLAIYGIPTEANGTAKSVPQVILVDLSQKLITATVNLNGIEAGILPVENKDIPFVNNRPGLAWDIPSNKLYVAHPTTNQITIVDLLEATTQQVSTTKTIGHLKGSLPGVDRLATLTPAGDQLFISSFRHSVTMTPNGTFHVLAQPLGIQQFDIEQMQVVERVDLPLYEMTISPDGRYLVATGMETEIPPDGSDWKITASGLYVLDTTTLETLKHFDLSRDMSYLQGFSTDSRYAYVTSFDTDPTTSNALNLQVIDLPTMTITAERTIPAGFSALLGTVNAAP